MVATKSLEVEMTDLERGRSLFEMFMSIKDLFGANTASEWMEALTAEELILLETVMAYE